MKRHELIPKVCSRCGGDLMASVAIINLPYEKRYLALCGVCLAGLGLPKELLVKDPRMPATWKEFWGEEVGGDEDASNDK